MYYGDIVIGKIIKLTPKGVRVKAFGGAEKTIFNLEYCKSNELNILCLKEGMNDALLLKKLAV